MVFHCDLPKSAYLSAMKENMSSHFAFGVERFTGFFIGNFFYITYHSGYEWNRRITNQKNTAIGFVKNAGDGESGCDVHFFQFKGLLCPLVFLPTYLAVLGIMLLSEMTNGWNSEIFWTCFAIVSITMAIVSPFYTLCEACTDGSIEGEKTLLLYLADPEDPYSNVDLFP